MADFVPESPSARLMREAETPRQTVDADGRILTLRPMGVLERLRLFKAVGPDLALNEAYLGIAYLAYAVGAIDDLPIPAPVNEALIEVIVKRLGDTGISAVADALSAQVADITPGN